MLTSTATLLQHLNDPTWIIFDCRHDLADTSKGERQYREGHIPGAHFAHLDLDLSGTKTGKNGRHPLPSAATFIHFLLRHGVTPASTVVAYDDAGGPYAARLWWLARWIGFHRVTLLDGGITKWLADGYALSQAVPTPQPSGPIPSSWQADPSQVVSAATLLSQLGSGALTLIDARAAERYRGEVEPIDPVAGHIPGALNRFFKDNLNTDATLRKPDDIRQAFLTLLQNQPPQQVVHQCGSGVTACANLFAMEYAGLTGSTLYAGSWSEWVADPTRPVITRSTL
ncbi:MAG: sulfurtransferase [Betaproteobacteria bacterium]|nr:sulfurtransferase [Betaproteobacteria bacterium]